MVVVKTSDRRRGIEAALGELLFTSPRGRSVLLKPNFNSADPAPGSTHNDALVKLVEELKARGAKSITIGERSGPPDTRQVMQEKGIFDLGRRLEFDIVNFEDLGPEGWVDLSPPGHHWGEGFAVARPMVEAEYIALTCCLKTHQYGGVFTMSLKLAVGATPKSLMRQLHTSPHQRKMIAEINQAFKPQLIVLDGVEAFTDGGPMTGRRVRADVVLAGTDRVAVDAVGLAVLKELGANEAVMSRRIFEQEQIQRAVELGLGGAGPEQIRLTGTDRLSRFYAGKLKSILAQG
ncbi:MAG: hypothetical protein A2Y56_04635 [Candidatus Aminicenantes bacterium RBG_13_63_10]|nr:MAG: hypothetical protein A2Y56_04635 [Candidatus Aminicenantes bacterium RBG_13_63_10]